MKWSFGSDVVRSDNCCRRIGRRFRIAALVLAVLALGAVPSRAEGIGAILIRGKVVEADRSIAAVAITAVVRGAGWTLAANSPTNRESDAISKCLRNVSPWGCVNRALQDKTIDRIIVLSMELKNAPDGDPMMVMTARLATSHHGVSYGGQQFCRPCTSDRLTLAVATVAKELLDRAYLDSGRAVLQVTSIPSGASVTLDGKPMGVTDLSFSALPGQHRVVVSHPGFPQHDRTVEAVEGKTVVVAVAFTAAESPAAQPRVERPTATSNPATTTTSDATNAAAIPAPSSHLSSPPEQRSHSWILPVTLISVGAASMVGGVVALAYYDEDLSDLNSTDPTAEQPRTYRDTGILSAALLAGGALTIGVGGWLWWRSESSASIAPRAKTAAALALRPGAAVLSVSGDF
jgi:PEGA domain